MELNLRIKESVVVEEIKAVELMRSCRAQFIYDRNYSQIGLQPRGRAPSTLLSGDEDETSVTQKKGKGICGRVSGKISFLTIPPHSQLIHNHNAEVYAP